MSKQSTCPICNTSHECQCRASLKGYLELLTIASGRNVSTFELSSPKHQGKGHIDKLVLKFTTALDREYVRGQAQKCRIALTPVRLRDKRWYLQVGPSNFGVYLYPGFTEANSLNQVITRPSAFKSFAEYEALMSQLFEPEVLIHAKVARLDLAVDYELPLSKILSSMDVKNKQNEVAYSNKGGRLTGVLIGKGSEKICVYDKAFEQGFKDRNLTRLELQLSGKKVTFETFCDLKDIGLSLFQKNLFSAVVMQNIEINPLVAVSEAAKERQTKLRVLLETQGYLAARKHFGAHGNFERDYGYLLKRVPWQNQPHEDLKASLERFFNAG